MTKQRKYPLTSKQEAFAIAYASGMNASDAYRKAYKARPDAKSDYINRKAFDVANNGKVLARVAELRKPVIAAMEITLTEHLKDLKTLRNAATAQKQFSAAISAEIARGRHSGVAITKSELTGPNGNPLYPVANHDRDEDEALERLSAKELKDLLALKRKMRGDGK